jgi:Domain of unknown function (DUF4267)
VLSQDVQEKREKRETMVPRSVGYWLAVLAACYLMVNAAWAAFSPFGFADRLGLPLADPADDGLLYVYASRSAVIALLALVLAARRDLRALAWLVLLAAVLPFVDATLVARAHAPTGTLARHLVSGGYLVVTGILLVRHTRRR